MATPDTRGPSRCWSALRGIDLRIGSSMVALSNSTSAASTPSPFRQSSRSLVRSVLLLAVLSALAGCSQTSVSQSPRVSQISASSPTSKNSTSPKRTKPLVVGLNRAVGFGLLRVMKLGERPGALDVVLYDALPNEMPRVAGVITTVMQTPLSHVNLRAVQDRIPNAVVTDALTNPQVVGLIGRYVRLEVDASGYRLSPATQAQVEAHHKNARPKIGQVPQRDLSIKNITSLKDIDFTQWTSFGVKAANVATLRTFALRDVVVPDGFGVPFSFYDEFMRSNGLYGVAKEMMAKDQFHTDPEFQDAQLLAFRNMMKAAPMPARLSRELQRVRDQFPATMSLRCRSSTNNEDLPGFSGAGLYDSKTNHPEEGPLDKCVKQVFSSVWNLRAYLEREYFRIDHLATAMGVLLIPSTSNEQANGVAVSIDPVYKEPNAYYVNAQLGEELVTNPNALAIPEELLLYGEGTMDVVTRSSLVKPGTMLLSTQHIAVMREALGEIHARFARLYNVQPGDKFAMEIEFKITSSGQVMIKQARQWLFD
jgi:hypothetical protein